MSRIPYTKIKKIHETWARANGYRPQASSAKPQAQPEVASNKPQATSIKHQAKIEKVHKHQATSNKHPHI